LRGRTTVAEVPIAGAPHLIALKTRAFRDLTDRRLGGGPMDAKDIKKHRSDVLRLLQVVTAEPLDAVPQAVRDDASRFAAMAREDLPDLRNLALVFGSLEEALTVLAVLFGPGS